MGDLVARVETSPPSLVEGQNRQASMDANGAIRVSSSGSGGAVNSTTLASGVTTNTTSAAVASPSGFKTVWAQVVGTGAVSVIVDVYGDIDADEASGVLLATITLSGTTQAQDAAASITANYPYFYVTTRSISGTGATVSVSLLY